MEEMLTSLQALAGKISPSTDPQKNNQGNANGEPDNDAIKMFVGQVPRSMDQDDIKAMFEEFGPVHTVNVLRDKGTGISKGCCFITFYKRKSALDAQNALHNIKLLPGMHHAIQMKPADTENRNERKLFVGMVCKKLNEENIRSMFESFGTIEECSILRDNYGVSKGCAFVTFSSRQKAIAAIKSMHHSQTMEGCSSPLVVKFADTQKEKENKKVQQLQADLWSLASINPNLINPQHVSILKPMQTTNGYPAQLAGNILGSPIYGHLPSITNPLVPQLTSFNNEMPLTVNSIPSVSTSSGILSRQLSSASTSTGLLSSHLPPNPTSSGMLSLQHLFSLPSQQGAETGDTLSSLSLPAVGGTLTSLSGNTPSFELSQSSRLQGHPFSALSNVNLPNNNLSNLNLESYYLQSLINLGQANLPSGNPSYAQMTLSPPGLSLSSMTNTLPGTGLANGYTMSNLSADGLKAGSQEVRSISSFPQLTEWTIPTVSGAEVTSGSSLPNNKAEPPLKPKQHEGPEGANLFIYHLPQELTDQDLHQTFQTFGSIVSAKVFIDKQTNLSKCFGFVSYFSPASATAAIQAMNGFQIGTKRLKVQLKRNKDASKPY